MDKSWVVTVSLRALQAFLLFKDSFPTIGLVNRKLKAKHAITLNNTEWWQLTYNYLGIKALKAEKKMSPKSVSLSKYYIYLCPLISFWVRKDGRRFTSLPRILFLNLCLSIQKSFGQIYICYHNSTISASLSNQQNNFK